MNDSEKGIVCLRSEVRYVESNRIHLEGRREFEIETADRLLIDLVQAGVGDVQLLTRTLEQLTGTSVDTAELLATIQDPRSVLEWVPHYDLVDPDVILCCFGKGDPFRWVAPFVQQLRKRSSVLVIGRDESVRGPFHQNASFATSKRLKQHENWYQFLQWARGTVRRFEDRVLILTGPIDAVLFGDLVPFSRSIVLADGEWPTHSGVGDMFGADWVSDSLENERRELHYAVRTTPPDELEKITRQSGSAFAVLEAHALRFSSRVIPCTTDHMAELLRLGTDPSAIRFARVAETIQPSAVLEEEQLPRDLLVVGIGTQRTLEEAGPFFQVLDSLPAAARPYERVGVRTEEGWLSVEREGDVITFRPWSGRAPDPSRVFASLQLVGLQRQLRPIWEAMGWPAPCWIVPSEAPHPVLDAIPSEMRIGAGNPVEILERLVAIADPKSPARRADLLRQQRLLEELDLSGVVRELLENTRAERGASPAHEVPSP